MTEGGAAGDRSVEAGSIARKPIDRPAGAGRDLRYPADRVCIVLLTGLGDVVMGLPVASALKDHGSHVTWIVEPMPSAVLRPHPSIDEVVVFEKKRGWRGVLDLRRKLAGRRFDLTINLNVYFKSVWPTLFSGAPHRLGFDRGRAFDYSWLATNHHVPARPRAHTQDMFLEFVDFLGIEDAQGDAYRIPITDDERRAQTEFFDKVDRPVVAIVPASANHKKDWLADRWARVVDALEHDFGYRTMLVGGRGEREMRIANDIVANASVKPLWAMGDPVRSMIWQLEGSALVMGPDTGPLHLARALGRPVLGLYGHTNPWRVGPWRAYQDLWIDRYTEPDEAPDPSRFDPKWQRMEQITPEDVLERVQLAADRYIGKV